jgi:hypothetical protein
VFNGELGAVLDDHLLADERVAIHDNRAHQIDRHVLGFVGVDGHDIEYHRRRRFLNLERFNVLVPKYDLVAIEEVHGGDHHKLHGGIPFCYQRPEDLKGPALIGRFEFKNIQMP